MVTFRRIKAIVNSLARIFEYVGWGILLGWVGLMFLGTIMRYVFHAPFIFQVDVVSVALVVFCTLCFASVFLDGEHIRVDLLTRFLPKKMQDLLWLFSEIVFIVFSSLVIFSSLDLIFHTIEVDSRLEVSNLPVAPFIMCIPLGFGLLILVILIDFIERVFQMITGRTCDRG